MPIAPGQDWGEARPFPADAPVARSDAEVRVHVEAARRHADEPPAIGLLGGDLCRTLGGTGDESRLRSDAVAFRVDVGAVLLDGRLFWFVAHLLTRSRLWTRTLAVMNAEYLGPWDVAPRSHPGDGRLDVVDARLRPRDLLLVRTRLRSGAHLPHPRISARATAGAQFDLGRARPVQLDGVAVATARHLSVRVEPAALTVFV